ncbi:MAG TPA: HNH endonuclease, partial [Candidatus Poseidoniales archaeon]|nr:HNH endonuclease [Candidatus Poseidoniales archaeon]
MNAMKALEQRYSGMLILAKNFLQTQSKNKNGSSLPKDRVRHIKNMGGQCPQCGVPLEGGNCNTEHIHDLSLGGENTLGNRVLICRMCNDYRNKMCQGVLGPPRYCNGYPGNWRTIKEYLIWSAVTIDDGFEAGKRIPEIHEKFLEYSTGGRDYSNKATRYFGRCSEWEIGDSMRANPTIRKPGLMTRFLDTIFGYEPKPVVISDKPKPAPTIVKEEAKEIIAAKKKPEKPAGSESKHVKTTKSP